MAYATIKYGSSGSDVKKLQQELNKKGYNLDVDGQFGTKTQSAVRDYQKKSGLLVDGVVGNDTWGKLMSVAPAANKNNTVQNSAQKAAKKAIDVKNTIPLQLAAEKNKRPVYKKSSDVEAAEKKLSDWEKNTPSEYESKYSEEINSILNDILNREKFSYNLNADPLYKQYQELYTHNGKKAMMDTVGEASALTGGYGSSYAVTAGSQAYQEYLNQLNGIALDLMDKAYEKYGDEGDKLFEDIKLLRSLDGDDYGKYLDQLERYYDDGDFLLKRLTAMSDAEYEQFLAEVDAWESDRDFEFKEYTDALDRAEAEKEFAFKQSQAETEMEFKKAEAQRDQANQDRDYELALKKLYSSGSSKSSESDKKKASQTINYPETYKEFCSATGNPGIMTESEYYAHDEVAKKYGTYKKYLKAMYKIYK